MPGSHRVLLQTTGPVRARLGLLAALLSALDPCDWRAREPPRRARAPTPAPRSAQRAARATRLARRGPASRRTGPAWSAFPHLDVGRLQMPLLSGERAGGQPPFPGSLGDTLSLGE